MAYKEELNLAMDLARGAAKIVLDHFGRVEKLTKMRGEAVTLADRASQRYIVQKLRERYPADGIVGEENDRGDAITFDCPDPAGRVWVIDPIDGTNNFIAGHPQFAVCIGLMERGRPVMGVVLDVCRDSVYAAASGEGAQVDGKPTRVPSTPLDEGSVLMLTANLLGPDKRLPAYVGLWLGHTPWKIRMLGSAALEAASIGAGVAHASLTINGKLWDCVPPAAIVLEAGGVVTDPKGDDIFPFDLAHYDGRKVPYLAGSPAAHATLLRQMLENP